MNAIERTIDALRENGYEPKEIRDGEWRSACPGHGGSNNTSLAVKRLPDSVVVHCHSGGCEYTDVLAAIGLTPADLFDNPAGSTYTYTDNRVVHRSPDKKFWQTGNKSGKALFNLNLVKIAVDNGLPVFVVEGEKDVQTLLSEGLIATCSAQGAGNAHLADWTPLEGATVYIVRDKDDPGHKYAQHVYSTLSPTTTSLRVVEAAEGKDATDHFMNGHTAAEFVPVEPEDDDSRRRLEVVCAADVATARIRYLWDKRVPLGSLTLMPGEEGIGKTTVVTRILADITNGRLRGEYWGTPKNVMVLAAEDSIDAVVVPRFERAGADLSRVHIIRGGIYRDDEDALSRDDVILPYDLGLLGELVRKYGTAVVNIDSLVTTLPDDMNSIAYKDTAKLLKRINLWADGMNVSVLAPWHINKGQGTDTAIRIMDSRAFRTAVRSMLLVAPDADAPEGTTQGIVALDKSNVSDIHVPALKFRITKADYTIIENGKEITANCGVAEWLGEVAGDGRVVARRALEQANEKPNSSKSWLRKYLRENGKCWREDVVTAAEELGGFKERSLDYAARELNVVREEEHGFRDGHPFRKALWSLPY